MKCQVIIIFHSSGSFYFMKTRSAFSNSFIYFIFFQFCTWCYSYSQDTIYLRNPSFEDTPRKGDIDLPSIKGWRDCGLSDFPGQSPPDIHPLRTNAWGVTNKAYDGKTYIGFVTRYSDTFEFVSQELAQPIMAGKCYTISVFLALSKTYNSGTQRSQRVEWSSGNSYGTTFTTENFSNPVELFIWGGDNFCRRHQLLAHSGPVANHEWTLFTFEFSPKKTYTYISIGAYYQQGYTEPYNGHVLVDALSPIIEINCKE